MNRSASSHICSFSHPDPWFAFYHGDYLLAESGFIRQPASSQAPLKKHNLWAVRWLEVQ
jgi:hypothetical protein